MWSMAFIYTLCNKTTRKDHKPGPEHHRKHHRWVLRTVQFARALQPVPLHRGMAREIHRPGAMEGAMEFNGKSPKGFCSSKKRLRVLDFDGFRWIYGGLMMWITLNKCHYMPSNLVVHWILNGFDPRISMGTHHPVSQHLHDRHMSQRWTWCHSFQFSISWDPQLLVAISLGKLHEAGHFGGKQRLPRRGEPSVSMGRVLAFQWVV